ncbi:MAG TPA: Rap1a/Tai family immunity protein [Methylobacterium sp.]|jgi:hypothetical protein|nr:Rap1a/Tai family immunity protein [Methylobacterium sp.]
MMRSLQVIRLAAIVCAAWGTTAHAQSPAAPVVVSSITTTALALNCQESRTSLDLDFCTGYITGAFDALSVARLICPAEGTTTAQLLGIGRKFLNDHPELWHLHPSLVVQAGFQAAFPCRR